MTYFSDFKNTDWDEEILDPGLRYDYNSQINAIRGLLWRQERADSELDGWIDESDKVARRTRGAMNEIAVDRYVELAHSSIYQSAAHSMAAVGMLAPLAESIFGGVFKAVGRKKPNRNLANNIMSLVDDESLGLREYMPDDLRQTLDALFLYRNKMFHYGFEWPTSQRQAFADRLPEWPEGWFDMATTDGEPWIFYMSRAFISHCIDTVENVHRGLARFQYGPGGEVWQDLEFFD